MEAASLAEAASLFIVLLSSLRIALRSPRFTLVWLP